MFRGDERSTDLGTPVYRDRPAERHKSLAAARSRTAVRGPIAALLDTHVLGTYLRFRIAFALAGVLAVGAGAVLLGVGGVWGLLALFALVVTLFLVLGAVAVTR